MTALIYISQDFSTPFKKKLAPTLTDIFYRLFTGFAPEWLLRDDEEERLTLQRALQNERARKNRLIAAVPSRHSRFGKDTHSVVCNANPHQRHRAVARSITQKHSTIFVKALSMSRRAEMNAAAVDFM
jgi:hypothetical protein